MVLVLEVPVSSIAASCSASDMMDLANKLVDMLLKLDWSRDVNASNRFLNASTAREESIIEGSLAEGTSAPVAEL